MKHQLAKVFSVLLMAFGHGRNNAVFSQAPLEPFHALSALDINGQRYDFTRLKGRKVIVVNTASECGYTPQYKQLQELYETYRDKGLTIVGFPSNDFGGQEPANERTIAAFCEKHYGVTFPMMSKVMTKGEGQHPVYQWLTQKAKNGATDSAVKWNFQKYLINEDGSLYTVVAPAGDPLSDPVLNWLDGKK
jgi:glutathione peroxidase